MIKKTKIALSVATASLTLAGALVSPQAAALTQTEANAKKTAALESQVNQMATMMHEMQAELSRVKTIAASTADSTKVQELDQWMASVRNAPVQSAAKNNVFRVRGGWLRANDQRGGANGSVAQASHLTINNDILVGGQGDDDAFYYGAAIDFNVNNDFFGLMDGVSFDLELGLEYAEFSDETNSVLTGQQVTTNQLRISAAPKVKFMHGSKLRPWIIPVGVDINIISPPSGAVTVMNTGMVFGAGADYELFSGISLGVDGRYHYSPDDVDGVATDGFRVGE